MNQLGLAVDQPQRARRPAEPIIRSAEVEGPYRWTATRAWGAGPRIVWCPLNPSLADGRHDDPTMWRMMGFSCRWGFGSMTVVNLYPFVTPHPAALRTWRASWRRYDWRESALNWDIDKCSGFDAWLHNFDVVNKAVQGAHSVVAAWGAGADKADVVEFVDQVTVSYDTSRFDGFGIVPIPVAWKCLGTTGSGAPIHPLARGKHRVPDDARLIDWRRPT